MKRFKPVKGKNYYQAGKEFGVHQAKLQLTERSRLYFLIKEYLQKVREENRELVQADREALFKQALILLKDDKSHIKAKYEKHVEKTLDSVLGILILNGDLQSGMLKQLEVLLEHDSLLEKAKEKEDIRLARDINKDRMEVYKVVRHAHDKELPPNAFLGISVSEKGQGVLAMGTPEECLSMVRQALIPGEKKALPMNVEVKLPDKEVIEVLPKEE